MAQPHPRLSSHPVAERIDASASALGFFGIVLLVLGVLALLAPLVAGTAVVLLVGVLVLAAGIVQLGFAFRAGSLARGLLAALLGVLTVGCGALMIAHPLLGLSFLTLLLAAYFVVSGVFEVIYAAKLRPLAGWGWMLAGGIVSVLLGVLIQMQWPMSGRWAVGVLVGVHLLFAGMALMSLAGAARTLGERVVQARA
jgi:uncharacterized membrane protein HdeD (DUF308 family)